MVRLDGMVQIVEALGDERVNLRPNNMPHTNSPFAILTHCVGLTRYFIGTALAGRQVHRDRDAEFRAHGTVAEIRQAVRELQQHLPDDLARVRGDQPCAFPEAVREPHRTWTQGRFVLQCYKELAQHHGHMELTRDVMLGHGTSQLERLGARTPVRRRTRLVSAASKRSRKQRCGHRRTGCICVPSWVGNRVALELSRATNGDL